MVRRYLHVYASATREEFARWWGMQPAPAGRIIKQSADELVEVDVEGRRAWILGADLEAMRNAGGPAPVRLLPGFDIYITATRPRDSLVERRFEGRVFREAGWISPVVLIDGMAAGVWRYERWDREVRGHSRAVPKAHKRAEGGRPRGNQPAGEVPGGTGHRIIQSMVRRSGSGGEELLSHPPRTHRRCAGWGGRLRSCAAGVKVRCPPRLDDPPAFTSNSYPTHDAVRQISASTNRQPNRTMIVSS